MPLLKYQDLTIQGKAYNEAYSDYWNSTASEDGQSCSQVLLPFAFLLIDILLKVRS